MASPAVRTKSLIFPSVRLDPEHLRVMITAQKAPIGTEV